MNSFTKNLNYIFWGLFIIIFDLTFSSTVNGSGIKIDILNDLIGASLVFIGIRYLLKLNIPNSKYYKHIKIAFYAASISIFLGFIDFIIFQEPFEFILLNLALTLFVTYGSIEFCKAMSILVNSTENFILQKEWKTASLLVLCFNFIPQVLFTTSNLLEISGSNFQINLFSIPYITIIFFIIQFIPQLYILWLLHKTKRTIKQLE